MEFAPALTVAETRMGAVFSVGLDDGAATGGIVTEPDAAEGPAAARVGGNVRGDTGGPDGVAGRDAAGEGAAGRTGAGAGSLSGTRFGAVSKEISSMSSSSGSAVSRVSSGSAVRPMRARRSSAAL